MNARDTQFYRALVEIAGGIFLGIREGKPHPSILFQARAGEAKLELYAVPWRTVEDVRLSLKNWHEEKELVHIDGW